MQSPVSIRPATDADAGQVTSLIAVCWAAYPGCVLDIAGEEPGLRAIASAFAARGGRLWVGCRGDWVVGSVGLVPGKTARTAQLLKVYVHPRLRRQGLARRLIALAEDTAGEWGSDRLDLWSDSRFLEAHAFYRAIGYTQTGVERAVQDLSQSVEFEFTKALPA